MSDNPKIKSFVRPKNSTKSYYDDLHDWWKKNGFSEHNWAWLMVALSMSGIYGIQLWMYFLWLWFDWDWPATVQKFWIEHIISNTNWYIYLNGAWFMTLAVSSDGTWQSFLGQVLYISFAIIFALNEFRLGTDALRYFDNEYWADEFLYPSLLYFIGVLEHQDRPRSAGFENSDSADKDIEIEQFSNHLIAL